MVAAERAARDVVEGLARRRAAAARRVVGAPNLAVADYAAPRARAIKALDAAEKRLARDFDAEPRSAAPPPAPRKKKRPRAPRPAALDEARREIVFVDDDEEEPNAWSCAACGPAPKSPSWRDKARLG